MNTNLWLQEHLHCGTSIVILSTSIIVKKVDSKINSALKFYQIGVYKGKGARQRVVVK